MDSASATGGAGVKNEEFYKSMKQVLGTLTEIAREENWGEGGEFLTSLFGNNRDLFFQFIGFLAVEIKKTKIPKPVVVDILVSVAMAGTSLGWRDGYADAKRIWGA
jgi:hypothetical protein